MTIEARRKHPAGFAHERGAMTLDEIADAIQTFLQKGTL